MVHKMAADDNIYGGSWSKEKLDCVSRYLEAYLKVFKYQDWPDLWYIDAFCGDGIQGIRNRSSRSEADESYYDIDEIIEGSALRALRIASESDKNNEKTFEHFVFIDLSQEKIDALRRRIHEYYPEQSDKCHFVNENVNSALPGILAKIDWKVGRAVCFIDPCATQLNWETIKAFKKTCSDVWLLFPIEAIIRNLPRKNMPDNGHSRMLDRIFGNQEWRSFYYDPREIQPQLFEVEGDVYERQPGFEELLNYFKERLETIFPCVLNPAILKTETNRPIFALYALISNESKAAQKAASSIASYLIDGINSRA